MRLLADKKAVELAGNRSFGLPRDAQEGAQENGLRPRLLEGRGDPPAGEERGGVGLVRDGAVLDACEEPHDPPSPAVSAPTSDPAGSSPRSAGRRRGHRARSPSAGTTSTSEYRAVAQVPMAAFEPLAGRRHAEVTERHAAWSPPRRATRTPGAPGRGVRQPLHPHSAAAFYETFPPEQARSSARRIESCYTPVRGSWPNMVEVEPPVLVRQCLKRRLPRIEALGREASAWSEASNRSRRPVWSGASRPRGCMHKAAQALSIH